MVLRPAFFFLLITIGATRSAIAEEPELDGTPLPKYEGGFAFGYFNLPEYPGSAQTREVYLPLPFFIYRGDIVRSDRDGGLRGRFLRGREYEFDISVGAAFPSDSEDNIARAGMPDLDWIGEVGPRLRLFLIRTAIVRLDLNFPIRHVFSTNFYARWNNRGFVFNPELQLRHKILSLENSSIMVNFDLTHATQELADYLYSVRPAQATPTRPIFHAEAGFFSASTSLYFLRTFKNGDVSLFTGLSSSNYKYAKNVDSPLMTDKYTVSYFLGMSYNLLKSDEMVSEVTR